MIACKFCGSPMNNPGQNGVCLCESCKLTQTTPVIGSENKEATISKFTAFANAAGELQNGSLAKARQAYEKLVADYPTDAEGYWGLFLCDYRVAYGYDTQKQEKRLTCRILSEIPVPANDNLTAALKHASPEAANIYRQEMVQVYNSSHNPVIPTEEPTPPVAVPITQPQSLAVVSPTEVAETTPPIVTPPVEVVETIPPVVTPPVEVVETIPPVVTPPVEVAKTTPPIAPPTDKPTPKAAASTPTETQNATSGKQPKKSTPSAEVPPKSTPAPPPVDEFAWDGKPIDESQWDSGSYGVTASNTSRRNKNAQSGNGKKKKGKKLFWFFGVLALVAALGAFYFYKILPQSKYDRAVELMEANKPSEAIEILEGIHPFLDSGDLINEGYYRHGLQLMEQRQFDQAQVIFASLGSYKDSVEHSLTCIFNLANECIDREEYQEALALLESWEAHSDSEPAPATRYAQAMVAKENNPYQAAIGLYGLGDYRDAKSKSLSLWKELSSRTTVSCGNRHTVCLLANGTVVAAGKNENGECDLSPWTGIVSVAGGTFFTVGLKEDGTVLAAGINSDEQCNLSDWTNIAALSAGKNHTVGLRSDGTVIVTGTHDDSRADTDSWENIVAISAGDYHTVGLRADGTVLALGANDDKEDPGRCETSEWTDIIAIAAGGYHTVGLKLDGTVVATGANSSSYDQCSVAQWTDIIGISAGTLHTVGLRADGTVVAIGSNEEGQCDVSQWTDIIAVFAGGKHTVGLKSDGTLVATGYNKYGQIELSDFTDIAIP